MIHGNLKKWEIILLGAFIGAVLLMKAADNPLVMLLVLSLGGGN